MIKTPLLCLIALVTTAVSGFSQAVTTVNWQNFSFDAAHQTALLLRNSAGTPLSQGNPVLNTDGFLVQLGYFSGATPGNNFVGTWIPLTGSGPTLHTTIGDSFDLSGSGNGVISFTTFFNLNTTAVQVYSAGPPPDPGTYVTQSSTTITGTTPPNNQVLSIRFFDTTDGASGHFNTVSANDWLWQTPTAAGPSITLDFESAQFALGGAQPLVWQDAANPFKTTLLVAIPEPTTLALLGVGLAGVALMRRRAKVA